MARHPIYHSLLRGDRSDFGDGGVADVNESHGRKLRGQLEFRISFEVWMNDDNWAYTGEIEKLTNRVRDIIEHQLYTAIAMDPLVVSLAEVEYLGKTEVP